MTDNIHRLYQNVLVKPLSDPVAVTATANSAHSVDTLGFNKVMVVLQIGTTTGTTPSLTAKLQSSPDNSTWTDVTGAAFPAETAAVTGALILDGGSRNGALQRYIRLVYTVTGTTPSFTVAATAILYQADYVDPGQDNAVVGV